MRSFCCGMWIMPPGHTSFPLERQSAVFATHLSIDLLHDKQPWVAVTLCHLLSSGGSNTSSLCGSPNLLRHAHHDCEHQIRIFPQLLHGLRILVADRAPFMLHILQQRLLQLRERVSRRLHERSACILGTKGCLHPRGSPPLHAPSSKPDASIVRK